MKVIPKCQRVEPSDHSDVGLEHVQIGVVFPQTEIGDAVSAVREYVEGVEGLGFAHLLAYEHVLGVDPAVHRDWTGPWTVRSMFHEPLVLFGFIAALTSLELVTGVVVLPQRQTALVAKQAAEVDLLTEGRFRLGVGVGSNAFEYEALASTFSNRGKRMDEQISLLRQLWTEDSVTHHGEFERVSGLGLSPHSKQRPIPIWLGAQSVPAYERIGRLGDGWFPNVAPGSDLDDALEVIATAAYAVGRDPSKIGMEARIEWTDAGLSRMIEEIERWRVAGATHVSINTMKAGLVSPADHLTVLSAVAGALLEDG